MFLIRIAILVIAGALYNGFATAAADATRVAYLKPENPQLLAIAQVMRQGQLLEGFYRATRANVDLPTTPALIAMQCNESNASYHPDRRVIKICYELVKEIFDGVPREFRGRTSDENIAQIAAGAVAFIYFHELGHAMVDLLDVPYFGKQEDVADQIATYMTLQFRDVKSTSNTIVGALWFFRKKTAVYAKAHFAGTHSLNEQRQFNIVCWSYGSNPPQYAAVAKYARLPKARADRCPGEYQDLKKAVQQLLGRRLKGAA